MSNRIMNPQRLHLLLLSALTALAGSVRAEEQDLTKLDLTTLMNMDVTIVSAAKRAQAGADAAAAVFVLTREDIRRSGAMNVPELLRFVPGVQVARAVNSRWAVTARGFNSRFANKLLVLVDGRSIYTSVSSGVYWEMQRVPLDLIERIEIVRGPGGALWGANAVNGVINIITRRAADTAGLRLSAGVGDETRSIANISYGAALPETDLAEGHYRVYAERVEIDSFDPRSSAWRNLQAGWRLDGEGAGGQFGFQGDTFSGDLGEEFRAPGVRSRYETDGGNVSLGWGRALAQGRLDLQGAYHWARIVVEGVTGLSESVYNFDAQYSAARIGRHLPAVGMALRRYSNFVPRMASGVEFIPARATERLWSLFVHDEIHFLKDDLRLILGAKIEEFTQSGSAFQPTLRGLWRIDAAHTVWAAASRAIRTPARNELNLRAPIATIPGIPPATLVLTGNEDLVQEALDAYELGWRWRPVRQLSFDTALFQHQYHDLIATQQGTPSFSPGPPPSLSIPLRYLNTAGARTRGAEVAADWLVCERLRLQANATWFDLTQLDSNGAATIQQLADLNNFSLRARLDLPRRFELDFWWRRVSELPDRAIDAYDSLNARLGWQPNDRLDISLTVDNLFDNEHVEFNDEQGRAPGAVLGRSVFARVNWRMGL